MKKADKSSFAGTKVDSEQVFKTLRSAKPIAKPNVSSSLEKRLLNDGDFKPFIGITKNLGRAEFQICPQYKHGKLVKISIYPLQQEDRGYYYEWNGNGKHHFTIQSYQGLDEPKVWMHSYCKEHKCHSMRMYVPNGANFIWFSEFSDNVCIGFTHEKW